MEIRDMYYFLAIVREGSITGAAKSLNMSQPALTRQLRELEEELGKQLIIRGNRHLSLTEEGRMLRKRAEEILSLTDRAKDEIMNSNEGISGDIYIGAGETEGVHFLSKAAKRLRDRCPDIHIHISSDDTGDVLDDLENGLIDFGLLFGPVDITRYASLPVPFVDTWGMLMRKDCELASKEGLNRADLAHLPLILPRGENYRSENYKELTSQVLGIDVQELNIAATYNLLFNASIMVADGLGYALCLDKILNLTGDSELCFRPFVPEVRAEMSVVWKRYQVFTRAAEAYLEELRRQVDP